MRVHMYVHVSAASRPPRRAGRRLASAQNERFIYSLASAIAIEFKVTCISNPPLTLDNAILAGSFTENEEIFKTRNCNPIYGPYLSGLPCLAGP